MRKTTAIILTLILCLTAFTGCKPDKEKIQSDFSVMVAAAATPDHIGQTAAFLDENISFVGEEIAGHMLVAYEEYLLRYLDENRNQAETLRPFFDEKTGIIDESKITDTGASELYANLRAGSIIAVYYEEALTLKVDYTRLLEKYGEYIPESLRLLYGLDADSVLKPMTENAKLNISWETLLDRAYRAEMILKKYPEDHLVKENAQWLYTTYLNALLMGTTNTPIFDYETEEFSAEAKAAYVHFMRENSDAVLTFALTEYFSYLESIEYNLDYNDVTMSKVFFDTCDWIVTETNKRLEEEIK
ncbi:MAG: hypothetical protein PHQ50_04260 [Eubacteriales bacterium]|nr:hypothetical protein [Eubacteriales bacterium]MDD3350051.1 hypothetical protein [Eubacteriales bacterium]